MRVDDDVDREMNANIKLQRIRSEFLVLSLIGASTSTVYGFWVLGYDAISDSQSLLQAVFLFMGVIAAFGEWCLFRKIARSVLGARIGEFLPGLSDNVEVGAQESRTPGSMMRKLVMLIGAGCIAMAALLAAMILGRLAGLLFSIAVFASVMFVGLSVIGMLIVLRR